MFVVTHVEYVVITKTRSCQGNSTTKLVTLTCMGTMFYFGNFALEVKIIKKFWSKSYFIIDSTGG